MQRRVSYQTHGKSGTRIYNIWQGMMGRCFNPNRQKYKNYGGRGIKVCNKWKMFEGFYEDMGSSYQDGLSLGRLDNDKDYEPANCAWQTAKEQAANRRIRKIKCPECSHEFPLDHKFRS